MTKSPKSDPRTISKSLDATVRRQELGDELRQLRAKARLALREVAYLVCVDQSYVSRIENGYRAAMREYGMVPENEIEDGMATRLCRRSVLEQRDPPTLVAIIDDLVFGRVVGSRAVMAEQLDHLVQLSRKSWITIRVVSNEGGKAGAFGSFELIDQPRRPSVVFVEQATSNLFIEQRNEVDIYRRITRRLLEHALNEWDSVERIAGVARRLGTELL